MSQCWMEIPKFEEGLVFLKYELNTQYLMIFNLPSFINVSKPSSDQELIVCQIFRREEKPFIAKFTIHEYCGSETQLWNGIQVKYTYAMQTGLRIYRFCTRICCLYLVLQHL